MRTHFTTPTVGRRHHPHQPATISFQDLDDETVIGALCDLFAGRTATAFGESLDWWNETLQCDLQPRAAAGVALSAISKCPFDHRASADGVSELRAQLLQRARMLIERSARDTGELLL
ncbi:hypothetical protein [Achromobacter xylosoxidans]|uniref:hypothetical protein n=1 Tax=Alcaligenes xylosoxydans xylosoxydans TaxID=85698 RepID=UPI001EEEE5E9|nr:hypothetical protein [Achromobacter xylosoxidans]